MNNNRRFFAFPYIFWIIIFTILPLLMIFWYGFTANSGSFTFSNVLAIFEPVHIKAFGLSVKLAAISTVICLILAYPLALILKSLNLKKKGFVVAILILPMWMNFILRILAWQMILSDNGILNFVFNAIGLPSAHMLNTEGAIITGMVYDYLPFMILPIYNSLIEINNNIIEAAKDLGAKSFTRFRRIILPLTVPGIISGVTMVFVPAMTTFVISDILGGGKIFLLGNVIEQEFITSMDWNLGSGLSIALMIIIIAGMTLFQKANKRGKGAGMLW